MTSQFLRNDLMKSTAQSLLDQIERNHYPKRWGFVIYRCSFEDDDATWNSFKQKFRSLCLERMSVIWDQAEEGGAADKVAEILDLEYIEDKKFDGASIEQVRDHFSAGVKERKGPDFYGPTRDILCLQVDKEVIHSVLHPVRWKFAENEACYVRVIDASWGPEDLFDEPHYPGHMKCAIVALPWLYYIIDDCELRVFYHFDGDLIWVEANEALHIEDDVILTDGEDGEVFVDKEDGKSDVRSHL